jgi:gliding motility-associated-like protein
VFTISGTPDIGISGVFNYTVTTTGGCGISGVKLLGTITVTVKPLPILTPGTICLDLAGNSNGTYTLEAQLDATLYTFIWNKITAGLPVLLPVTIGTYTATSPGTYTVQAFPKLPFLNTCASDVISVVISPVLPPASAVTVTSDYFADLQTVSVAVTPAGDYEYQIDNGVFQSSPIFQGVGSGGHTVLVRNACGTVTISSNIVDFPKVFTPNGDGVNDTWNISELSTQPNAKIYIFDRFGKLLKQITPSGNGWTGFFNNQELPATDYWFTLSYEENGIMKELKSHFALKR